jgi:tetratricopeptide (TPR) repeat protein
MRTLFFILFVILFASCTQSYDQRFHTKSKAQRKAMAEEFYNAYELKSYQGSRHNQAMYDTLIRIDPFTERWYRQKSIAHTKIGDYHIAFPLLEKAARLDPKESLYYYSWLLVELYRDYDRALHYLTTFDTLTPNQVDYAWGTNVHLLKGLCHKQKGDYPKAIAAFNDCIASEPFDAVDVYTFVYRGICYTKTGEAEKAIADFDEAIRRYERCTMAYFYKGQALWTLQRDAEGARAMYEKTKILLAQGYKKTDPYIEVFDEVHLIMVEDALAELSTIAPG